MRNFCQHADTQRGRADLQRRALPDRLPRVVGAADLHRPRGDPGRRRRDRLQRRRSRLPSPSATTGSSSCGSPTAAWATPATPAPTAPPVTTSPSSTATTSSSATPTSCSSARSRRPARTSRRATTTASRPPAPARPAWSPPPSPRPGCAPTSRSTPRCSTTARRGTRSSAGRSGPTTASAGPRASSTRTSRSPCRHTSLAGSVDVLRQPIYLWRARVGDSTSITQRRTEPRAIRDRTSAVDGVSRFMAEHGEHDLKRRYDRCRRRAGPASTSCSSSTRPTSRSAPSSSTWSTTSSTAPTTRSSTRCPPSTGSKWHLVRRRLMPELLEVLRFEKSGELPGTPVVRRGRSFYGNYPFRGDADPRRSPTRSTSSTATSCRCARASRTSTGRATASYLDGLRLHRLPRPGQGALVAHPAHAGGGRSPRERRRRCTSGRSAGPTSRLRHWTA